MRRSLALAIFIILLASGVAANPMDRFGFGGRAMGMASAYGGLARDYTAVYYNPAMLGFTVSPTFGLTGGYMLVDMDVDGADRQKWIDLDGDGAADTSKTISDSAKADDAVISSFGLSIPVGGVFEDRLALGVGIHLPGLRIIRVRSNVPDKPFFLHYDNSIQTLVIMAGAGAKILDWFTIGVGSALFVDIPLYADAFVNITSRQADASQNPNSAYIDAALVATFSPTAGVAFEPLKDLTFGLAFRDVSSLNIKAKATIDLGMTVDLMTIGGESLALNLNAPVPLKIEAQTTFRPRTVAFSHAYDWSKIGVPGFRHSFELDWYQWSAYKGNYSKISVDASAKAALEAQINELLASLGPLVEELNLSGVEFAEQMIYIYSQRYPKPNFRDIIVPRIGFEYDVFPEWTVRAGYAFEPTPVPDQTGLTSYADSDKHIVTIGSGFHFEDPLQLADYPVELDLFGQFHYMTDRTTVKEHHESLYTPDSPYDKYTAGGMAFGGGVSLTYKF